MESDMDQNILKMVSLQRPPEILYHYTTQEGLLGIIKDKVIWATHTQYLNDQAEFSYALRLAEEEISRRRKNSNKCST